MCAALGDQYFIAVLKFIKHSRASYSLAQVALVACEEDGKGGKLDVARNYLRYLAKRLRIGYHHSRLLRQGSKKLGKLCIAADERGRARIEYISDSLLLRQN